MHIGIALRAKIAIVLIVRQEYVQQTQHLIEIYDYDTELLHIQNRFHRTLYVRATGWVTYASRESTEQNKTNKTEIPSLPRRQHLHDINPS